MDFVLVKNLKFYYLSLPELEFQGNEKQLYIPQINSLSSISIPFTYYATAPVAKLVLTNIQLCYAIFFEKFISGLFFFNLIKIKLISIFV